MKNSAFIAAHWLVHEQARGVTASTFKKLTVQVRMVAALVSAVAVATICTIIYGASGLDIVGFRQAMALVVPGTLILSALICMVMWSGITNVNVARKFIYFDDMRVSVEDGENPHFKLERHHWFLKQVWFAIGDAVAAAIGATIITVGITIFEFRQPLLPLGF